MMNKGQPVRAPINLLAATGGDDAGGALRSASYTANNLNQYTSREVSAYLNVLGIANANASVTVNSQSAYRKGEYFQKELSVNNASTALWQSVTNIASLTGTNQTNTGNLFLPKTAEAYAYDLDGNLTSDGRWTNKWDAENRLIDMTSHSSGPSGSRKSLQFAYDSQGRRYSKVVSNWTGSAWTRVLHEKFLYDGWNLLGAFNGTNAAIIRSFLWGLDLSGSMQGAGGVGGLIAFRQHSGSLAGSHFAAYDGNGNVMALVDGKTGSTSARYEYDPFGQTIRASGTMATVNPVRFSSKVVDDETDYAYYGYRYLNPNSGRWLNRDPIGERGGKGLYSHVRNTPTVLVDYLGLDFIDNGVTYVFTMRSAGITDREFTVEGECVPDGCGCELRLKLFRVEVASRVSLFDEHPILENGSLTFKRLSGEYVWETDSHEAKHRWAYRSWHDHSFPSAQADFAGKFISCGDCEEKRNELEAKWNNNWYQFDLGEAEHTNLWWWDYFVPPPTYAPEEEWYHGGPPPGDYQHDPFPD